MYVPGRWQRLLLIACICNAWGCRHEDAPSGDSRLEKSPFDLATQANLPSGSDTKSEQTIFRVRFSDVHEAVGLEHAYLNGASGQSLMTEAMGGGAGWFDYDNDGWVDLYLNQGGDATALDRSGQPIDRLFRNLGAEAFEDVSRGSQIHETGYSQGVAIGDFDNDGFDDVYVTNVGGNRLFHNLGDGTFEEVTAVAGVRDGRWSSSAAWGDLDADGDLDLYVCNYLQYDPLHPIACTTAEGEPRMCHPRDLEDWPDECYINQGDGTFRAEAKPRGLFGPGNKALGVAIADFTNDGLPDVYIANDTTPNFLFINEGAGKFRESAAFQGCAVDRNGFSQASMGLAVGDYDGNGWLDIYSTHFHQESNTLYRNLGLQGFDDVTARVGLHEPTLPMLGFGTVMHDFDQDGQCELIVANGHIENYAGNPIHKMLPQLFTFDGDRWKEVGSQAGEIFQQKHVSRAVATADFDNDGDMDVAMVHQNESAALLKNDSAGGNWIKLRFIGINSNRRGIGVRVQLKAGSRAWLQEICGGTSYASSHEPILVFGLGDFAGDCELQVRWPSGKVQQLKNLAVNQTLILTEP